MNDTAHTEREIEEVTANISILDKAVCLVLKIKHWLVPNARLSRHSVACVGYFSLTFVLESKTFHPELEIM